MENLLKKYLLKESLKFAFISTRLHIFYEYKQYVLYFSYTIFLHIFF